MLIEFVCPFVFVSPSEDWISNKVLEIPIALGDFNNDNHWDIIVAQHESTNINIFLGYGNGSFPKKPITSGKFSSSVYFIAVGDFNQDNWLDIAVANHDQNNIGIFLGYGNGSFTNEKIYSTGSSRPLSLSIHHVNNDTILDIIVANDGTNNIGVLFGYGNGTFTNQMTYSTGFDSLPYAVAAADFNNDNQLDIVVANSGTNNIGVFLGKSDGTFLDQTTYPTGKRPISVAVGDFNNDTRLDIVVSYKADDSVGLLLGNGNGTFKSQLTYATKFGSRPSSVIVRDCNKDNRLDIIVVNNGNNNIGLFLGNGDGTFKKQRLYPIDIGSPQMVVAEDLNNDTWMDIIVAIDDNYNVGIFLGGPDKNFTDPTPYSTGGRSNPNSVAVGDFNNDAILDIVIANSKTENVGVSLGYGDGTFTIQVKYPTGTNSQPYSVALGDFNNDSRLDIVVANKGSDNVGVLLGNGDGTFSSQTAYSTGSGSEPYAVAVGDLNGDNQLDIVVTNYQSNQIGVLLGNGNGTFLSQTTYSTGSGSAPSSVAISDLNGDNQPDIIVTNYNSNRIGVFLGKGNGTFSSQISYSTGLSSGPYAVTVGDLNGDNRLDIIAANYKSNTIGVFLGNGNGSFSSQITYSTESGSGPCSVTIGDLNDDNQLDIIVANYDGNTIGVLLGNGNGFFSKQTTYSTGWDSLPISVALGDFNRDDRLDVVVVLYYYYSIAIFFGYYNSPFTVPTIYSSGSILSPFALAVADFNNDSRLDIITTDYDDGNIAIYLNSRDGTFHNLTIYSIGYPTIPYSVAVGDFNNDGCSDIVIANYDSDNIIFFFGFVNGSFGSPISYTTGVGSGPCSVAVGDFNKDGRLDVINANNLDNTLILFLHYGFGAFKNKQIYSTSSNKPAHSAAFGHFNQDNLIDMVVLNYEDYTMAVLLGNGDGSFVNQTIYSTGSGSMPYSVAVGDVNNDTRLDVVVANRNSSNVGVFLGNGDGTFSDQTTYRTGSNSMPTTVALADFNNDGRLDIAVTNGNASSISVFLGNSDGTFRNQTEYSTGNYSFSRGVAISDFNNDSHLDIVVSNLFGFSIGVFLGNGDGTFSNQTVYPTGDKSLPFAVAVGDFNHDNRIDIVVANYGTDNIGIFLGQSNGIFLQQVTYSTGALSGPYSISIDDFNKDGRLDIATVLSLSDDLAICFGDGNGTFSTPTIFSTGPLTYPWYLIVYDFNYDNWLDIAVVFGSVSGVGIFLGDRNKIFLVPLKYSTDLGSAPQAIIVNDFNNDKHLDLAVTYSKSNNIGIFLGLGNGNFSNQLTYSTGINSRPWSIAVADLNKDMQMDIIVTNRNSNNVGVFLGYGNGIFGNMTIYSTGPLSDPRSVAILDFNKDNKTDILVAGYGANSINIFQGNGDGTFSNQMIYLTGYNSHPVSVAVGDFNMDDWMDVAVTTLGTKNVKILLKLC